MNLNELDALYLLVQVGDNRRDPDDVILNEWGMLLAECEHYHIAVEAVRQHRREKPGVYLEPGHILANYRALARKIIDRAELATPTTPPDEVAEYLAELRAIRSAALADPEALKALTAPPAPTPGGFRVAALERGMDIDSVGRL